MLKESPLLRSSTSVRALRDRIDTAGNYERLCEFELEHLERCLDRSITGLRVGFAGSGPLPLSAWLLAQRGAIVTAFDIDPLANAAALAWLRRYPTKTLKIETLDVRKARDLREFDVVYIAGLVGHDAATKRAAFDSVGANMKRGSILAARSVKDGRRFLYPAVELAAVEDAGFDVLGHFTPPRDVVNSIVLAIKV